MQQRSRPLPSPSGLPTQIFSSPILAAYGHHQDGPALARELQRVREEGLRLGFIRALRAIESALAA
jgi:hypothetical protein